MNKHYYFVLKKGVPTRIIDSILSLKLSNYIELTEVQLAYYLANQNATVEEVWNIKSTDDTVDVDNGTANAEMDQNDDNLDVVGNYYNKHYYYFKTALNGTVTIKLFLSEVNTRINKSYTPFTEEQLRFYITNPNASIEEIRNARLNEVPQVDEQLENVKRGAIEELSYIFSNRNTISNDSLNAAIISFLKDRNSLVLKDVPEVIDSNESKSIIAQWATNYNETKQLLAQYTLQVNSATTENSVNEIMDYVRMNY